MSQPISTQRNLRLTNVVIFFPAFVMLLIHGILGGGAFPAVALIPLAISGVLGVYLLNPGAVDAGGSSIRLTTAHVAVIDLVLTVCLFIMCFCCWANVPHWRYDGGLVMLGTYGSVWVMVSCAIHAYLAVLHMPEVIALFAAPCPECGKPGTHSHHNGQRRFQVQNGFVQLARDQTLPKYAARDTAEYQRLP